MRLYAKALITLSALALTVPTVAYAANTFESPIAQTELSYGANIPVEGVPEAALHRIVQSNGTTSCKVEYWKLPIEYLTVGEFKVATASINPNPVADAVWEPSGKKNEKLHADCGNPTEIVNGSPYNSVTNLRALPELNERIS